MNLVDLVIMLDALLPMDLTVVLKLLSHLSWLVPGQYCTWTATILGKLSPKHSPNGPDVSLSSKAPSIKSILEHWMLRLFQVYWSDSSTINFPWHHSLTCSLCIWVLRWTGRFPGGREDWAMPMLRGYSWFLFRSDLSSADETRYSARCVLHLLYYLSGSPLANPWVQTFCLPVF